MTVTFTDFISVLTLLLVAVLLLLIRQLGQRRSHRQDSAYRSTASLSAPVAPSPQISAAVPNELERLEKKSPQERWARLTLHQRNIARRAANGQQNGEIAHALNIRSSTVSTHMKSIYKILEVHSRRELTNLIQEIEE